MENMLWRKIEAEGEFEITVSESRLEKDEEITLEYTAEIWCGFANEKEYEKLSLNGFLEEQLRKDVCSAIEKVYGKKGEKRYDPRISPFTIEKETAVAEELNEKWENPRGVKIDSFFFAKHKIRDEDYERIKKALLPRPEEYFLGMK